VVVSLWFVTWIKYMFVLEVEDIDVLDRVVVSLWFVTWIKYMFVLEDRR